MPRILICYLVRNSGHHSAARALEAALHQADPAVETLTVDLLEYTHPQWSAILQKTYMGAIRTTPELWELLYDSPVVDYLSRRIRRLIRLGGNKKVSDLMERFKPDAAVCTQAHPLAVLGAYAELNDRPIPLWGVVTDYVPHRFWVIPQPAAYIVPNGAAADRLAFLGVDPARILPLGIPIHPDFTADGAEPDPGAAMPRVLVMGGSRGLGITYRTIRRLDECAEPFSMEVVTGSNQRLRTQLLQRRDRFKHPLRLRGYARAVAPLMRRASVLVSKPGGLTSAEAMAVGLPMILVRPLPGQETGNADVLVRNGAAVHLTRDRDVPRLLAELLRRPGLLAMLKARAKSLGRPQAALEAARAVLKGLLK